jgi:hypothetical protein
MRQRSRLFALASAALLALVAAGLGCASTAGTLQRGINCYNTANYPCAAAAFQDVEMQGASLNQKGHIRFLAYRGLTYFHMGQAEPARRLMSDALVAYRAGNPAWLPQAALAELNAALAQVSGGAAPPPPAPGPAPQPNPNDGPSDIQ